MKRDVDGNSAPTSSFSSSSCWSLLTLERSFVVLLVTTGVFILFMSSMLVQQSHNDLFSQYLNVRRAYRTRFAQQQAEGDSAISNLVNAVTGDKYVATSTEGSPLALPVTDPPWMNRTADPVLPYRPRDRRHPFLRGNVLENPKVCGNASVDLLILIHSAVQNAQRRRVLRETWAGLGTLQGLAVRRVFLLGRDKAGGGNSSQVKVNTEQATFQDIVQGDFLDTFPNLTHKAVTGLRWINDHCLQARFLLKADDDMFVDVFRVAELLLQELTGRRHAVMCDVRADNKTQIERGSSSRWYVPQAVLQDRTHWPTFCSGYVLLMTTDVVPALYRASFNAQYVPVDDGFVYGVLPLLAWDGRRELTYISISANLTLSADRLLQQYEQAGSSSSLVGGSVRGEAGAVRLWQAVLGRLSRWARGRAPIVSLRGSMADKVL